MTAPDKRRAMLVYLRDLADGRSQHEMACAQLMRESGDLSGATSRERASQDWHAIMLGIACLLSEYESGLTGKFGVSKTATAVMDAMASAYIKARAA